MFDQRLRPLIDPPLERWARWLARRGASADAMTATGCALGLGGALAIGAGWMMLGLALFLAGRLADGLDGPLARLSAPTARGGFVDIVADFAVYGAIPVGFGVLAPGVNGLPAAILLFSFYLNGAAFLAFSALAAQHGLETSAQGRKSIYYVAGLAEGAETIAVFTLMMAMPDLFPVLAYGFAALTCASAGFRCILAWTTFAPRR